MAYSVTAYHADIALVPNTSQYTRTDLKQYICLILLATADKYSITSIL